MPRFFNTSHSTSSNPSLTNSNNITHVIELYSYSDEYVSQVQHEIMSGTDSGSVLTAILGQKVRFVYAPDPEKFKRVLDEAHQRGYTLPIINLYEPEGVQHLLSSVKPGDSILISGQGDIDNGLIAGRDAEDIIDILETELELKNIPLNNLDIDSCRMGRDENYRKTLRENLTNFQTITTYTDLCSISNYGGKPCRIWISETEEDGVIFYDEKELYSKGTRIIEYTDSYKNSLKDVWKANPENSEEIDLSDMMVM